MVLAGLLVTVARMPSRHRIITLVAAALLSAPTLAACSDTPAKESAPDAAGQAAPDLKGLPAVVAVVDDTEISKDQFVTAYEARFQQASAQAQQSGEPLDQDQLKEQTVESMVNTELLVAEADSRGYDVSQDDIDGTLAELAEQSGLSSPDELLDSLAKQGVDKDEANRQLEGQVKLDRLIAEEVGDADPTDKELRELYDQGVAQQEASGADDAETPSFDELRPQLEEQVRAQNENSAAQSLVDDLRKGADITINL